MSQYVQVLLRLSSHHFAADRGAETSETSSIQYVQAHLIRLELLIKAEVGQPFVDRKTRILHDEYNCEADRVNID